MTTEALATEPQHEANGREKIPTSYSFWQSFRNCRMHSKLRYLDKIKPIQRAQPLVIGSCVHECIDAIWRGESYEQIILQTFPDWSDRKQIAQRTATFCMMDAYRAHYADEEYFPIVMDINGETRQAIEVPFELPLVNPETGASSRTFFLKGVVDAIVQSRRDHLLYIMEHKSWSYINGDRISRLWNDFQIMLYADAVSKAFDIPIAGIVYNILSKCGLGMKEGETDAEFEERKLGMKQPGRAKKKIEESPAEYAARVRAWYQEREMPFHRELILLDSDIIRNVQAQLWDLSQEWLSARRRNAWYQNDSYCYRVGGGHGRCEFIPLCSSKMNPVIMDTLYYKDDGVTTATEESFDGLEDFAADIGGLSGF